MISNLFSKVFSGLSGKKTLDSPASQIYGRVVAQSRNEVFFTQFNIPDTVIGRYDMLALHVFLLNNRLKFAKKSKTDENEIAASELSQSVFDLFLDDIERGLRELGFADTSVHKRKKRLTRSYYALIDEFDEPIANSDRDILAVKIENRYFADKRLHDGEPASKKLAQYVLDSATHLAVQSNLTLLTGKLDWPDTSGEIQ